MNWSKKNGSFVIDLILTTTFIDFKKLLTSLIFRLKSPSALETNIEIITSYPLHVEVFCHTPTFTEDISICESLPFQLPLWSILVITVSMHIIHLMLVPDVPYNISSFPPQFISSMSHSKPIVPAAEHPFLSSPFLAQYYFSCLLAPC